MSPFYTTVNIDFALMADQLVGLCLQEFGKLGIMNFLPILNFPLSIAMQSYPVCLPIALNASMLPC